MNAAILKAVACPLLLSRPVLLIEKFNLQMQLQGWWLPVNSADTGSYLMGQQSKVVISSGSDVLLKVEFVVDAFQGEPQGLKVHQGDREIFSRSEHDMAMELGLRQQMYCSAAQGPNELIFSTSSTSRAVSTVFCTFVDMLPLSTRRNNF